MKKSIISRKIHLLTPFSIFDQVSALIDEKVVVCVNLPFLKKYFQNDSYDVIENRR